MSQMLVPDYVLIEHQAAAASHAVVAGAGCSMGDDYAMEDRMRRIRERYWERHTALPIQEQPTRKLLNPPLGAPNLLG